MDTIAILKEAYGYNAPIILRRVRIGGKSKTAIRQDLSRAYKKGEINKIVNGVYYFGDKDVAIEEYYLEMLEEKYIKNDYGYTSIDIEIYGYYTGDRFLKKIDIKKDINNKLIEIVTNNTSSKRKIRHDDFMVIIRKGKTQINKENHLILQFLDLFYVLDSNQIKENKDKITNYFNNNLNIEQLDKYLSFYPRRIKKALISLGIISK